MKQFVNLQIIQAAVFVVSLDYRNQVKVHCVEQIRICLEDFTVFFTKLKNDSV